MSINKLVKVLVPPVSPAELPPSGGWPALESRLQITLPLDYKEFINQYGSGYIIEFLCVLNPFSDNPNLNLEKLIPRLSEVLVQLRKQGEDVPYPTFPETGGILPFAMTDNGDVLYWLTEGLPDSWPVIADDSRSPVWERFDMPMTEVLVRMIEGKLPSDIFPDDLASQPPTFQVDA